MQLNVTPFKYKERRPWPFEAQVRQTPPDAGRKELKPKELLQTPPGAPLVAPDPQSIGTIPGQLVQVSKEEVVDNVHIGDVAKYSFYDQVTLQAKVKEDIGAVTWAEPVMVRFPMWMKGHPVGRDPAAFFIGGTLYQIKGDSHSYVQLWRVHGGQLKHAKRVQWSGVVGASPCGEGWGEEGERDGGGKRRATTPTNRGTVLVCPVPRNQSLVPGGARATPKAPPRLFLGTTA